MKPLNQTPTMNTTTTPLPTLLNTTHGMILDANTMALGGSLLAIDFCIILFNILTIMVIVRFRTKNAVDIFVLTLALHDLTKGVVPVPITVYVYFSNWRIDEGSVVSNLYGWVAFMTNAGSMLILTLMAIERFGAILKPFTYRAWVTPEKIQIICFTAVAFTAFHSALPLMGVGRIVTYYNGAYSHFDYSRETKGTIIYSQFILCYGFGMILVVVIAYSFVFYKIRTLIHRHRRMSRVSGNYNTNAGRELNLKTETMFSYLALALMLLFSFSWLPFLSVVVASQMHVEMHLAKLDLFAMRVVVVNSMLNPLAYAALCRPYRIGIIYYFRKVFSKFGFERPNDDIWDPWRRASMARRRTQPPDRYTSHSCTDSGIGGVNNDYSRQRIPSTFQSYDTYRAKKEDKHVRMNDDLLAVRDNGVHGLSSDDSAQFDDSVTRALLDNTFGVVKAHAYDKKKAAADENQNQNGHTTLSKDSVTSKDSSENNQFSPSRLGHGKKNKYTVSCERNSTKKRTQSTSNIPSNENDYTEVRYIPKRSTTSLDTSLETTRQNSSSARVTFSDVVSDDEISRTRNNTKKNGHLETSPNKNGHNGVDNEHQNGQHAHSFTPSTKHAKCDSSFRPKSKSATSLSPNNKNNENNEKRFDKNNSVSLDFYRQDLSHTRVPTKTENNEPKCIDDKNSILPNNERNILPNPKHTSDNGCLNVRTTVLKDFVQKVSEFDSDENETIFCCRSDNMYFLRTCDSHESCDCNCDNSNESDSICDRCSKLNLNYRANTNEKQNDERTRSSPSLNTCLCTSTESDLDSNSIHRSSTCKSHGSDILIPVDVLRMRRNDNLSSSYYSSSSSFERTDEFDKDSSLSKAIVMYENPICR